MTMPHHLTPTFLSHTTSPLGTIWLAARDAGLCGLWFEGQKHMPDFSNAQRFQLGQHRFLDLARAQIQQYFNSQSHDTEMDLNPALKLDLSAGTAFQQSVWQALLKIPRGSHTSYGALATQIGKPAAVRAAASAVGRNPISIFVPCHRVLGKNGSLTGYAGGLDRKEKLLRLESVML